MTSPTTRWKLETIVPLALFVLFAAVPLWGHLADNTFYIAFFARILIYGIAVAALNLALGFGGLVSLGHALFLGIGAYCVAIPSFYGIDNGWLHLLLAVSICAVIGLITGAISLRTSGIGFIMITLAFAQMGYFLFVSLKQYGGDDGTTIAYTSKFFGIDLGGVYTVYITAFLLLVLLTWWTARLRKAPFGMVVRGARQNARRVSAVGFPARRYLLVAYVISAVLTGLAGLLLANLNSFASPETLSWIISGDLVVMLVLGGLGTVFGPVVGAFAFLGLEEILKMVTDHWLAVFGLAIVVIGLVGKAGIIGLLASISQRFMRGPSAPPSSSPAAPAVGAANNNHKRVQA